MVYFLNLVGLDTTCFNENSKKYDKENSKKSIEFLSINKL